MARSRAIDGQLQDGKLQGGKLQDGQLQRGRRRKSSAADKIYPLFLVLFGCVFLTVTGSWNMYTDPLVSGGKKLFSAFSASAGLWGESRGPAKDGNTDHNEGGGPGQQENLQGDGEPQGDGNYQGDGEPQGDEKLPGDGENLQGNGENPPKEGEFPGSEPEDETGSEEPEGVSYQTVEDDYFADAVFIGDSRTVGLFEYGGLEETSTFYASTGLTVHKLFTSKIVPVPGQKKKKITVEEALSQNQFAKVYLMIGINEMGTGTPETFLEKYAECVTHIQELQPDAIIYLQSIMCVTDERSSQGDYITNEGINVRNEGIAALADGERIFYLDVNQAVCDENGAMKADYTYDGVHLKAQYIPLWKDYLKTHAVTLDVSP